jgi:hypothetical protein
VLIFTAKPQRRQRESLFFNSVRGGIEKNNSGLPPKNYPKGSESFFLSVLYLERKNYSFFAFFAALR